MATDRHVDLPNGVWTQLGIADITNFTLLHVSGRDVLFRGMVGPIAPPASITDGLQLAGGVDAARSNLVKKAIAEITPLGTATRIFARPDGVGTSRVYFANDADMAGVIAITEGIDVFAAAGTPFYQGDLDVTDAIDTLAATGVGIYQGDMDVTEVIDTLAATGTVA